MAGILENIGFNDQMTPILKNIISYASQALRIIDDTSGAMGGVSRSTRMIVPEAKSVNDGFSRWTSTLMGVNAAVDLLRQGMQMINGITAKADEQTMIGSRMGLINDGLRTQAELQQQVFQAAQRSRGVYGTTADAIAKLGILAEDAFNNNGELILFAENLNKSFKLSGASAAEMSGTMTQLTQGLASGALRGEELRSVLENGGLIANYIAEYLNVPKGALKDIAAEGGLTAQVVKNAMFAATDDINSKFAELPMTFTDIKTQIGNTAAMAFQPAINAFNMLVNSPAFANFVQLFTAGMYLAGFAVTGLINVVQFLFDIINAAQPFIIGFLITMAAVYIPPLIAQLWAMLPPILAQAAAWLMVNWPILLVIGVIGLLIKILGDMGVTFEDVLGFVGGLFGVLYASVYNTVAYMWNTFAVFAEFLANVFNDPIGSIVRLFMGMADNVLSVIQSIAEAIDLVFGSGLAGAVQSMRGQLSTWTRDTFGEAKVKVPRMDQMGIAEGIRLGVDTGRNIAGGMTDMLGGIGDIMNQGMNFGGVGFDGADIGSVGKIKEKVDISSEDLKFLKELAETQYINQFTTATLAPQLNVQFGDVKETADVDQLAGKIARMLTEEIAVSSEGVYA